MKERIPLLNVLHDLSPMPEIPKDFRPIFPNNEQRGLFKNNWVRAGRSCIYCGSPLSKRSATVDHLLPVSKGGMDIKHNLVVCCGRCNVQKGTRSVRQYVRDLLIAARNLRRYVPQELQTV